MRITTWTIGLCLAFLVACSSVTAQENMIPTPQPKPEVPLPGMPAPEVPAIPEVPQQQSPIAKWPALFDCGPTQVIVAVIKGKYQEQEFILNNMAHDYNPIEINGEVFMIPQEVNELIDNLFIELQDLKLGKKINKE